MFNLNVLGLLLVSQEAVKHIGPAGGSIINISSVAAACPANASVYSGTKAAVDAVTKSLAKELGPRKIRVNSINPGMVETEGTHAAGITESDFRKQIESKRRWAESVSPKTSRRPRFFCIGGIRLDYRRNALHLGRPAVASCTHVGEPRRY